MDCGPFLLFSRLQIKQVLDTQTKQSLANANGY
jgi:hypothetical protein